VGLNARGTARRWILRAGKKSRAPFNRILARYSEVGDPPVFDPATFPWIAELEKSWRVIQKEAEQVLARREELPPLRLISPDHERIAGGDEWKSYLLYGYGYRAEANCHRCPETVRLLEQVPGLLTAFFSVMTPGTHLAPHKGVTKAMITCHLPLIVPEKRELCRLQLEEVGHSWREGESFVFDDTYRHEVWNRSDEDRVVLLLHFRRPVRFAGSLVGRLFLGAVRRSPFIRDARRNQAEWDRRIAERIDPEGPLA
jgi:beta-hydroxylase